MENYKENLVFLINTIRDEICDIKGELSTNRKEINEIKEIINKLKQLEESLNPKQKWLKEKSDKLDLLLNDLLEIRFNIIMDTTDEMFKAIDKNLLDGMKLEDVQNSTCLRNIIFEEENIGCIEVIEKYKPDIKIRVTVYENTDEFEIHDPGRMYSIISFINTKFNYKDI